MKIDERFLKDLRRGITHEWVQLTLKKKSGRKITGDIRLEFIGEFFSKSQSRHGSPSFKGSGSASPHRSSVEKAEKVRLLKMEIAQEQAQQAHLQKQYDSMVDPLTRVWAARVRLWRFGA